MPIVAIRTLADLRSAVHVGAIGVANISTADLYLDLAEGLLGAEFACGNLVESIEAFEKRFPNEFNASIIPGFDDDVLYRKWRSFILKLLRLAGHAEGVDPVIHLNIFAKREGIVPINQAVYRRAFPDLPPAKVSRETAIEFDRPLRGLERQMFRQVTTTLDRLRTIAEVTQLGLLGPGSIGPLPKYAHGDQDRRPLPPQLGQLYKTLSPADGRLLARVYNIGVDASIFSCAEDLCGADMLEGAKHSALRDAIARITSEVTANVYLNTVKRVVGCPDTELALPTAKQQKAMDTKPRAEPKPDPNTLPEFIEMAIADFKQATNARRQQVKELRSVFRRLWTSRSASSMEELLDDAENRFRDSSANLSPLMQTLYGRALRAYLKHIGQGCPWTAIGESSKRDGMPRRQRRGLATVRRFAAELNSALTPADITTNIAEELFALARSSGRNKDIPLLRTGFAYLDALRPLLPELLSPIMIGQEVSAPSKWGVELPEGVEAAIRAHAQFSGFTPAGEKALVVACRKLVSVTRSPDDFILPIKKIPFARLIADAIRRDPKGMRPYRTELLRLDERLRLEWTPGWRNLQNCVVAAGVSRADNPVEAMLNVARPAGLEPWQMDREWAFCHERDLRPDLRLTWSNNVDRLDALHAILGSNGRNLLPPERLGPMPPRGDRLRNAVYPLPKSVELAIEGETPQMLESAHFVWRCARDLGIWQRGDAPDARELFTDNVLERVAKGQTLIAPASADHHRARIEDWRRGRLDWFEAA